MKKSVLTLVLLTIAHPVLAGEGDFSRWKWGIGFTLQSFIRSGVQLEVGTPALAKNDSYLGSVILSYTYAQTEQEKLSLDPYNLHTTKIMWEGRHPAYQGFASLYYRLGLGYMNMSKDLHREGGSGLIAVHIGTDFIVNKTDLGSTTTFIQWGVDGLWDVKKSDAARNFSETQFLIGFRHAY